MPSSVVHAQFCVYISPLLLLVLVLPLRLQHVSKRESARPAAATPQHRHHDQ
jgi:hypothetical protein